MQTHPSAEFDILSRARWMAEALASGTNLDMAALLDSILSEATQVAPEPDEMSWFAMQRLAQKSGLRAVRFEQSGQSVAGASLIWVSKSVEANADDAKILSGAALVIAGDEWNSFIQKAKAKPRRHTP